MQLMTVSEQTPQVQRVTSLRPVAQPVKPETLPLLAGEELVATLPGEDGAFFRLTSQRVIYTGGQEDVTLYAAARLEDVVAVEMTRRPRDRRSAAWAALGLAAAIGVWQVSPNGSIGVAAGAVMGIISLGLLAAYWVRPSGLWLSFRASGAGVSGAVSGKHVARAPEFASMVQAARAEHVGRSQAALSGTQGPVDPPGRAYPPV